MARSIVVFLENLINRSSGLQRLIHLGVHDGLTIDFAKRITMSNWIVLINIVNVLCFIWIFPLLGMPIITLDLCCSLIISVLVLFLNSKRLYTFSRFILVPWLSLHITFIDYAIIESETVRLFLYPISILGFLIYGQGEKYWAMFGTLVSLVCVQFITYISSHHPVGLYHVGATVLTYFDLAISTASLLTTALLVIVFYIENQKSEKKIEKEKEKLKFIFDQIEEAVMITDARGLIQPEYSKFTEHLFNRTSGEISNMTLLDVLFRGSNITSDMRDQCMAALQSGFEGDEIQWIANQNRLIRDLEVKQEQSVKNVQLTWQPIYRDDIVKGVIVTAQDVTIKKKQVELEAKIKAQEENINETIQAIHQHSLEMTRKFFQKGLDDIARYPNLSNQEIANSLHTLKGSARTLGLKRYSAEIHDIEELLKASTGTGGLQPLPLQERLKQLKDALMSNQKSVQHMFGERNNMEPRSKNLYEIVARLVDAARLQAKNHGFVFGGIAVHDSVPDWDNELSEKAGEILLHAVTNSIDHGYVLAWQEKRAPRKTIQLHAKAEIRDGQLCLEYYDEGAGISEETLQKLLTKAGPQAQALKSPLDVLFLSGISSAQKVTETSGRGVGMSAIQQIVKEARGEVTLLQTPGNTGLQLSIRFPILENRLLKTG